MLVREVEDEFNQSQCEWLGALEGLLKSNCEMNDLKVGHSRKGDHRLGDLLDCKLIVSVSELLELKAQLLKEAS